jgi:hypothetical protein
MLMKTTGVDPDDDSADAKKRRRSSLAPHAQAQTERLSEILKVENLLGNFV